VARTVTRVINCFFIGQDALFLNLLLYFSLASDILSPVHIYCVTFLLPHRYSAAKIFNLKFRILNSDL